MANKRALRATPRSKRLNQQQRLAEAALWLAEQQGRYRIRGYRRHFGVSAVCAALELRMLGCAIPDEVVENLRREEKRRADARRKRREQQDPRRFVSDIEAEFLFIAGTTAGGFPYGVRYEDLTREPTNEGSPSVLENPADTEPDRWDDDEA